MINASQLNTLRYEPALCTGCRMCAVVCPHGVFAMNSRLAELARPDACMECGACQLNCPNGAIAVESGVGCATAMILSALTRRPEACFG
jgi:NAD-dependent dihydropyrimidine dehydrogenase PreA subunit